MPYEQHQNLSLLSKKYNQTAIPHRAHATITAEATVLQKSSIKARERKVLYIFSFLTFWFFCVKAKEQEIT